MIDGLADAIFLNIVYYSVNMVFACQIFINKHAKSLRGMGMFRLEQNLYLRKAEKVNY